MPSHRRWKRFDRHRHRRPPSSRSTTNVSDLCPDVLELIFDYLPDLADRGRAAQVCRSWRYASLLPSIWRGVEAKLRLERAPSWASLRWRRVRRVRVLSVNSDGVLDVVRRLPRITSLSLKWCAKIRDESVALVARYSPDIESLDLTGCAKITDAALLDISTGLKKLKTLDLSLCSGITDDGIRHLTSANLDLEVLVLSCCCDKLTNRSLQYISVGLRKLESIDLSGCHQVTDSGLRYLAKMPKLRSLNLSNRLNISSNALAYLAVGGSLVSSLRLDNCVNVKNSGLFCLTKLASLTELSLRSCYIGDMGLSYLSRVESRIESMDLGFCDNVTDVGLSNLSKMASLRQLDLTGCRGITEAGLGHLADGESLLTSLCVRDCGKVGSEALTRLARGLFTLRQLMLDDSHLTDEGKVMAANNLVDLEVFQVMGTDLFHDLKKIREHPVVIRLVTTLPAWGACYTSCKACYTSTTHVSVLPQQVLALIFHNLDVRDKGRAARVCVSWRNAAYHQSVWSQVDVRLYLIMQSRLRHTHVPWSSMSNRGVRRVQAYRLNTWGLRNMIRGLPRLQSLDLQVARHKQLLPRLLMQPLPHLTRLKLNICDNIFDDSVRAIAAHLPNLTCLEMTVSTRLTDAAMLYVATGLRKLRLLSLTQCRLVTDVGVEHLASTGLKLTSLSLRDCQNITDKSLQHLVTGMPGLESLDLGGCHNITNGNGTLSGLTNLRGLHLSGCRGIGDAGLAHLAGSAVTVLDLEACAGVTDDGLMHLAKMVELRRLDLSFGDCISDKGLLYLTSRGGLRLTKLNIRCCDKISERALQLLAKNMTDLRGLTLDDRHINEKGRTLAARNLIHLDYYRVSGFNRIHDLRRLRLRQLMDDILTTL